MASFLRSLWWASESNSHAPSQPPSPISVRPPSMRIQISEIHVRNLPSPASSVDLTLEQGESGVRSSAIAPNTSLAWLDSDLGQQELAVRPSSVFYLRFFDGNACVFDAGIAFADIVAGFPDDIQSSTCACTARDLNNNQIELKMKIDIPSCLEVASYDSVADTPQDDHSDKSRLGTLLRDYITLERTYCRVNRVHPLIKRFIAPALSLLWFSSDQSVPPAPVSEDEELPWGIAREKPAVRPLLDIVLGMHDLISTLSPRLYTVPQEHQPLMNQIFAELCRCTALLEKVYWPHEDRTPQIDRDASKEEEYFKRQEQLFILVYRTARLLYKKIPAEESTDTATIVKDLLDYVRKDRPNQLRPYSPPFIEALLSPRGYARDAVWSIIVNLLKQTEDAGVRDSCRGALSRLVQASGDFPADLWADNHIQLDGLRLIGNSALVWKATAEDKTFLALKMSTVLERRLKDSRTRQDFVLAFITWKYVDHPRLLPILGIRDMYVRPNYVTCIVSPWLENRTLKHLDAKSKLSDDLVRRRCMKEIVEGMIYLHSMGIVHGSLKAANVFMGEDEHILISDYGTWRFANKTQGKHRWLSPELWDAVAAVPDVRVVPTMKSDVWSFACLCIELYTEREPWGESMQDSDIGDAVRLRSRYPPRPDNMKSDIWEILKKCWVRTPAQRPDFITLGRWLASCAQ